MDDSSNVPPRGDEDRDDIAAGNPLNRGEGPPADRPARAPMVNLPPLLLGLLGLLIGIFLIENYLLDDEARYRLLFELAFTPLRYVYPLSSQGMEWLWTPVTYSLLHGGFEHLVFNGLWLAAFGAPVLRRLGSFRFLLFWALSAAAAAFFHAFLNWGQETILVGASGVISALMAAACRFAFPSVGGGLGRADTHLLPRQGPLEALRNRTVLAFTLLWFAGNILIAVGIPLIGDDVGPIAWDAHIGGFLFGYLLFDLFDPLPAPRRT